MQFHKKVPANTFINTCLDVYESNDFSGLLKELAERCLKK